MESAEFDELAQGYDMVSIPFKREGAWKDGWELLCGCAEQSFQFPSNGKEHGK